MRWLLNRFGVDEALVGDIEEERRAGRSAWWLARQVFVAVARMTLRDWRLHPWLALRAIAVGWLCLFLAGTAASRLFLNGSELPFAVVFTIAAANTFIAPFAAGWLVARLHRKYQVAMVACFCLSLGFPLETIMLMQWGKPLAFREAAYRTVVMVLCALVGGLLPAARRRSSATPSA